MYVFFCHICCKALYICINRFSFPDPPPHTILNKHSPKHTHNAFTTCASNQADFDGTTIAPEPTESVEEKIKEKTIEIVDKVAQEIGIPMWGMVTIIIGVGIVILAICFWCIRRCFRKRRGKDGKKGGKGVDLKSVQLLGSAYKEKVRNFPCGAV